MKNSIHDHVSDLSHYSGRPSNKQIAVGSKAIRIEYTGSLSLALTIIYSFLI